MKKNNQYEEGKQALEKYIAYMTSTYEYNKKMIEETKPDIMEQSVYDVEEGKRFCKLWEVIQTLKTSDRNLILTHIINNKKPNKTLEVFNGIGGNYKNVGSLKAMISLIKKKIRLAYEQP